jgi:hypothetical protein
MGLYLGVVVRDSLNLLISIAGANISDNNLPLKIEFLSFQSPIVTFKGDKKGIWWRSNKLAFPLATKTYTI